MSSNLLESSIPEELFDLGNLFWLDLSTNTITGTLSTSLAKMKQLTSFNVRRNMIGGSIPNAFDDIPKLDFILLGAFPSLTVSLSFLFPNPNV
jgi:Leucine-rich repeat (LRR) protein